MRKRIAVITGPLVSVVVVVMALASPAAGAAPPAFGQLPVMGYNTWYQYGAGATESEVLEQADDLVSSGLAAAGYDTVNLDDGWMASARTGAGSLTRPSGPGRARTCRAAEGPRRRTTTTPRTRRRSRAGALTSVLRHLREHVAGRGR